MNNNLPRWVMVMLAVAVSFAARPSMSAMSGGEIAAAEAAIRQLDAAWAAAASTANVDAWMAFYGADAVVLAPDVPIANDREHIRKTVADLLALPHLSIAWHPSKVEVAGSGDFAYLIGAYELSYDDPRAMRVSDAGKLLEVWKRQADGSWRCIVDTWNSNGSAAAARAEPSDKAPNTEYGDMPTRYEASIRQYFETYLTDPGSVQYLEVTKPEKGYATTVSGAIFSHEARLPGWRVSATIKARNSRGTTVGPKTYVFLFHGEKIVHTTSPLPEGEMK